MFGASVAFLAGVACAGHSVSGRKGDGEEGNVMGEGGVGARGLLNYARQATSCR